MRILLIGRGYPGAQNASWGLFEILQARALRHRGHDVVIAYVDTRWYTHVRRIGRVAFVEDETGLPVRAWDLPFKGLPPVVTARIRSWALIDILDRVERERGRVDVVYAHYPAMTLAREFVNELKRRHLPLALMEHWSRILLGTVPRRKQKVLRHACDCAAYIGCVSGSLRDSLARMLRGTPHVPIGVIPNLIAPSDALVEDAQSDHEQFEFVVVGRLAAGKRVDLVMRAFDLLTDDPRLRLTIVGDGSARAELENQAMRLSCSDRISFTGGLSNDEVRRILGRADCYVTGSPVETFGVPVVEAWTAGSPCVVPDNNPLRDYFSVNNGILYKPESVEDLARALQAARDRRFDRVEIAAWADGVFSPASVASRIESGLLHAIASRSPSHDRQHEE